MSKISFSQEQLLAQKDLERILWEVFWSYSKELGLEENEKIKDQKIAETQKMIPDFAEAAIEMNLQFDYPIITLFLTSIHLNKNLLRVEEAKNVIEMQGPDNNAKIYLLTTMLKERGILWQHQLQFQQ